MSALYSSLHCAKNVLRQEIRVYLESIADTIQGKSRLICNRLMAIDAFRLAWQSQRLMSFVSMPLEVNTIPLFEKYSMIVPYCEAEEIVPTRILSLDELEPSGSMKILEPKFVVHQNDSRRILPEQIAVVLVPGLAFDRLGNRLGRGKGYYDRFLRRLPENILTIGLTFGGTLREQIPYGEQDCPVKLVITESAIHHGGCLPHP